MMYYLYMYGHVQAIPTYRVYHYVDCVLLQLHVH